MPTMVRENTSSLLAAYLLCSEFMRTILAPVIEASWYGKDDRPACHPETRSDILQAVCDWAASLEGPRVCWISGGAGTGKSTIARTLCEKLHKKNLLAGSFFVSRRSDGHHSPRGIVQSLAYHLAHFDFNFRHALLGVLRADPRTKDGLLKDQVLSFVKKPLSSIDHSCGPLVVVLDAFDECDKGKDGREGGDLLPLLLEATCNTTSVVKLIITSRPEDTIERMLQVSGFMGQLHTVNLQAVPRDNVKMDILQYLRDTLATIRAGWPPTSDLEELVRRAGVLFVYASTVINFISDRRFPPEERLQVVLGTVQTSSGDTSPYEQLDSLYMQLLYTAVQKADARITYGTVPQPHQLDATLCRRLQHVAGAIVLLRDPLSESALEDLLYGETRNQTGIIVKMLSAVLLIVDGQPIQTLHPSFTEFLLDNNRCTDKRFQIDQGERHLHLVLGCLSVMNKHLCRNMCRIEDPSLLNSEIADLNERMDKHVPAAVQYACKYWISHLAAASQKPTSPQGEQWMREVKIQLSAFCSEHVLHWMELASLVNHFPSSLSGLNNAIKWCLVCQVHLRDRTETNLA
jgi:hypothetical protein